jgi:peptidylprolyl isomerase
MKLTLLILALCTALVVGVAGCGGSSDSSTGSSESSSAGEAGGSGEESSGSSESGGEKTKPKVTVPTEVSPDKFAIKELEEGSGAEAKKGDEVTVQYVGVGYDSEKEFDSSWSRNEPFTFTLGEEGVIEGWNQGIEGMKVGGRREMLLPPELAYGAEGRPPKIGPNETLVFVIDLLAVK